MSAPAWGNDGRSRKPDGPEETREKKTGEIGARQLVDMYFDGTISPAARTALDAKLEREPELRREVRATKRVIEKLRAPVGAPDMSDEILRRVAEINGFASAKTRRRVWGARLAVAACLLGVLGTAVTLRTMYPEAPIWASDPAPVSDASGGPAAAHGARTITSAVDAIASKPAGGRHVIAAIPLRPALKLGGSAKYDPKLNWRVAPIPSLASGGAILPGTLAVFKPDGGETAMAVPGSALAGVIPEVGPATTIRPNRTEAVLKLDRPWWLWSVEEKPAPPAQSSAKSDK